MMFLLPAGPVSIKIKPAGIRTMNTLTIFSDT